MQKNGHLIATQFPNLVILDAADLVPLSGRAGSLWIVCRLSGPQRGLASLSFPIYEPVSVPLGTLDAAHLAAASIATDGQQHQLPRHDGSDPPIAS